MLKNYSAITILLFFKNKILKSSTLLCMHIIVCHTWYLDASSATWWTLSTDNSNLPVSQNRITAAMVSMSASSIWTQSELASFISLSNMPRKNSLLPIICLLLQQKSLPLTLITKSGVISFPKEQFSWTSLLHAVLCWFVTQLSMLCPLHIMKLQYNK